jgi:hypothetical protein
MANGTGEWRAAGCPGCRRSRRVRPDCRPIVRAFRQILAQQPFGVFASTTLPGTERVAEVHIHAGRADELLMMLIFALVVGKALP